MASKAEEYRKNYKQGLSGYREEETSDAEQFRKDYLRGLRSKVDMTPSGTKPTVSANRPEPITTGTVEMGDVKFPYISFGAEQQETRTHEYNNAIREGVQNYIASQRQKTEKEAREEARQHEQSTQSDAVYYTEKIDYAVAQGDYKAAKNWMDKMVRAPLTNESRQAATNYINNLYENKGTWGEAAKTDAEKAVDTIIYAYDRGADTFAELMTSEEGQLLAKTVEQEFGVKYDTNAMKDPTQYISDLKGNTDSGAYWTFYNGQTGFLNQNAYTDFENRAFDEMTRAAKSKTSSAQMDSYVRAQTAYTVLDKLYNYLDVGGNTAGVSVNDMTAKYLIAELKQYGVDLYGIGEENYRERIQSAMEQQSYKARVMRSVLQKEGYDTEAVRQYVNYQWNQLYEQNKNESVRNWANNAGFMDKLAASAATYAENTWLSGYNTLGTYAQLIGVAGNDSDPNKYTPVAGQTSNAAAVQSAVGESFGDVGGFFYGVGSSMIESTLRTMSFGGFNPALGWTEVPDKLVQVLTLSQMGVNVAGTTANQILSRGGNAKQAIIGGIAAGGIEALTEVASLQVILDKIKTTKSFLGWLEGIGLSALAEGSEEGASNILNIMVDACNMGNLSEQSVEIQKLLDEGKTLEEAQALVLQENIISLAEDIGAGALSGGGEGLIAGGAGYAKNKGKELWYGRKDKEGNYKHLLFFTEEQQKNTDEADKAMLEYEDKYFGGYKVFMKAIGFSEEAADRAAKDYQRIRAEYQQIVDKNGSGKQSAATDTAVQEETQMREEAPQQTETAGVTAQRQRAEAKTADAETMIRAASPELDGVDSRTFIPEKAAEDAQAVFELYSNLEESGVLRSDMEAAASMVKIATTAMTNVQNAQTLGMMRAEDGGVYETALRDCIDGARGYLTPVQSAPVQNSTTEMPVQQTAPANTNDGGMNNGSTTGTEILEGRNPGVGTDGQTGAVGEVAAATGRQRSDTAEIARAVAAGQAERRSAKSLGIDGGSTHETMNVLTDETVARIPILQRIRQAVEQEGATAVFFTGKLEVWNRSGKRFDSIEGLRRTDDSGNVTYYVKADGISRNAEQIYKHEYLHGVIQNDRAKLLDLAMELEQKIGRAGVEKMVAQYVDAYKGIYGTITESMTADEITDLEMKYIEEIFADAYANIHRGKINNSAAVSVVENQRGSIERARQNRAATDRTNGPNGRKNTATMGSKVKYSLEDATIPTYEDLVAKKPLKIVNIKEGIASASYADMKKATLEKAGTQGWYDKPHLNDDTKSLIFLTEKSFTHAFSNLSFEFGEDTIRCMAHIPEVIKEAYLVSEDDPKDANKRETKVYSFFGAVDGINGIEPVKLTIKEFDFQSADSLPQNIRGYFEKNGIMDSYRSLYDAKALEVIGIEGIKKESDASVEGGENDSLAQDTPDSVISVADLLALVNENAKKYIPSKKNVALSDAEYLSIAEKYRDGTATEAEIEQLRKMVDEAAKKAGYTSDTDWRMDHKAPNAKYDVPIYQVDTLYGGDGSIYSNRAAYYYGDGRSYDQKAIRVLQKVRNNPNADITVYRAVPTNRVESHVRNGDWVTTVEEYAKEHGDRVLDGEYRIIKNTVPAKYVYANGDSIHEYGYDDGKDYGYRNTENNRKLLDLVTYDDNGNIIPLSERFNPENEDIRYSVEDDVAELDEGYRRAVERDAAEDEPTGKNGSVLPKRQRTEPDYADISFEIMEQRAKDASLPQLRQMAKSAQSRLDRYRWAERNDILTPQMEAKMKATKTAVEIYNEQLKTKNAEEKAKREKQKLEDAQNQKPKEAKKRLKASLAEMYSIPAGSRKMANELIENLANKMIQTGKVTNEDRIALMDALFRAGVVNVAPEGYYGEIRSYVQNGRIYVPEDVRAEFGDDWNDFRKRAFANRIYLTNDAHDIGIDIWNADLASMFPGGFDEMGTDRREMLENIVRLAEEGRTENLTIAEMMKRVQDNEGITVEDQMDALDEQAINALETFAREANLEVKIRREGAYKVLAERQRFRNMIERESAARRNSETRNKVMRQIQQLNRMRRRTAPEIQAKIDETLRDIDTVARSISDQGLENLMALAAEYEKAKAKDDPNFIPSPYIEARLARMQKTQLDDMSIEDVTELGRMVSAIATTIENRNKLLAKEYNADIDRIAEGAVAEMKASAGSKGGMLYKWTTEEHLSPVRFLKHLGGWVENGTMHTIAQSLENGQTRQMQYLMEASKMFDSFVNNKENRKWMQKASGKNAEWIAVDVPVGYENTENGQKIKWQKIEITPMMRVALLMHSQNYDNLRHIQGGGIRIPNKALYVKGDIQEAYARGDRIEMSPETVKSIVKKCTAQERAFAGFLKKYYDEFSKEHINEVSMQLDGFERAAGNNYYHIKTDPNFLAKLPKEVANDISVQSIGSIVNERVHAQNPIVLEEANVSLADHMELISKYYGFAVPIRDFTAIMDHTSHEKGNIFSGSVKEVMARQWGAGAQKYLDKLMADLQGTTGINEMAATFLSSLRGKLAGAQLMFNPAVAISQMASYPGAMQTMGAKALLEGLKAWEKVDVSLIEKYSPLLWYRNQGNSTQELGDYMSDKTLEQKLPWLLGWIQMIDSATVRRLWAAAEHKVRNETDLAPGNEADIAAGNDEFYQKVADVFNRAVYDTQPNYTTMQRAQILRSKSDLTKALTMFKTVPIQYYNMMYEAAGRLTNAKKRGDKTEIAKARKYAANTMIGVLAANTVYVAIKAFFKWWKFPEKDYRDENGKLDIDRILKGLGLDLIETYAGSIIGGAELVDVVERIIPSIVNGEYQKYNGTEITALGIVSDVVNDVLKLSRGIGKLEGKDIASGAKELAKDLVMAKLGLPANNIETYLLALTKWISPETAERYATLFEDREIEELSEETGRWLEAGISVYMDNRAEDLTDEVKAELLNLWVNGNKNALPNAVPNKVSINGKDTELAHDQKQAYRDKWSEIVSPALPELMQTEAYINADISTRAAMVDRVYEYANQVAKSNLDIGFEADTWVQNADQERLTDYLVYVTMESKLDRENRTEEQNVAAVTAIMEYVLGGLSDDDCEEITRLYMDGADGLIPKLAPNEITYNDENCVEHTVVLDADARSKYQETWRNIIGDQLSYLMGSEEYAKTDDKTRTSMISRMLKFASEAAKSEAAPERAVDNWITNGMEDMEDGIALSDYIIYRTEFSKIDAINEDGESENGLAKQRTLDLISRHEEWTDEQKISVFLDNCEESDAELVPKMQSAGFTWNQIRNVIKETSKARKKKALLNSSASDAAKMKVLPELLDSNETMNRYRAGVMFGVSLKDYAEVITNADTDDSGRISQAEATEYIKSMALPIQAAAYLWQMVTDAKNGKKNPFSSRWGAEFYGEVHAND